MVTQRPESGRAQPEPTGRRRARPMWHSARDSGGVCGETVADFGGAQRLTWDAPDQLGGDRLGYSPGRLGVAEVVQEEADRQDSGDRVGDALPGDVRGGAVHRLE